RRLRPGQDLNRALPKVPRHESCRYVVIHDASLRRPVELRLYDAERRFVPRRFRVDVASLDEVAGPEVDPRLPPVPLAARVLQPLLFPGAAYPVSGRATGLRGRVLRA